MLPATFVALICTFDQSGCCCASAGGTKNAVPAIARKAIATTNVTTVETNDLFRMCLPQFKRRAFYHSISAHLQGSVAPHSAYGFFPAGGRPLERRPKGARLRMPRCGHSVAKVRPAATALKEIFTRYARMWLEWWGYLFQTKLNRSQAVRNFENCQSGG